MPPCGTFFWKQIQRFSPVLHWTSHNVPDSMENENVENSKNIGNYGL